MAETIKFEVTIVPRVSEVTATNVDGGSTHNVVLSTTNLNALNKLLDKLQAGANISTVVTAINAL